MVILILAKMTPEHAYTRCFPIGNQSENAHILSITLRYQNIFPDAISTLRHHRDENILLTYFNMGTTFCNSIIKDFCSYEIEFFGQKMNDTAWSPFQIN